MTKGKTASGVAGFFLVFYTASVSLLDWLARGEYILQKARDGWVDTILGFVVSPPPWAVLMLVLVGFLLMGYSFPKANREEQPSHAAGDDPRLDTNCDVYEYRKTAMTAGAREAAILLLAQLRSKGVVIRNDAGNVVDTTLSAWLERVHTWMLEVIEAIGRVNAADAEYFRTLDVVPPARVNVNIRVSAECVRPFVKAYNEHDLRLVRLDEILKRYRQAT